MHAIKADIEASLKVLNEGGIILYPTDTIWGIGCDATNPKAVSRIYSLKQREDSKSMLVLLHNSNLLSSYMETVPDIAWELLEAAEDPLTIIYPGAKNLATNLIAEDGSIGIRVAREAFCEGLIQRFRRPIVSTSANISGEPSPPYFDEITSEIKENVDYVVRWRQDDRSPAKPSSIIKLGVGGEIRIIRK